jgi:hypothetical protein
MHSYTPSFRTSPLASFLNGLCLKAPATESIPSSAQLDQNNISIILGLGIT